MLLETDITVKNSPDTSSQVPIILNKSNKFTMDQISGNCKHRALTSLEQLNKFARLKPIKNSNSFTQNNAPPLNVIFMTSDDLLNRKPIGCKIQYSQFYPYADENDGNNRFQLSKSAKSDNSVLPEPGSNSQISNDFTRQRLFGNDRTNLIQMDRVQTLNRSQNGINVRKENLHTINITNNKLFINSNTIHSGKHEYCQDPQENPTRFRNYDLNDEYWFNFE